MLEHALQIILVYSEPDPKVFKIAMKLSINFSLLQVKECRFLIGLSFKHERFSENFSILH